MLPKYDIKNEIKIIEEIFGVKYLEIAKLIISTYNSIRDYNPIYYIKHIPKPMYIYTILKLIDDNPSDFDIFSNQNFRNPITFYIQSKIFKYIDQPLIGNRYIFYD